MVRLITGSSGFIGSHLRGEVRSSSGDADLTVRNEAIRLIERENPIEIVHCAAIHGSASQMRQNHRKFLDQNVSMDLNLLFAAARIQVPNLLMISTTTIFSELPKPPYSESDLIYDSDKALIGYSQSKRMTVRATTAYQEDLGLNWKTALLGNTFGPGMSVGPDSTVIGNLMYRFKEAIQNDTDVLLYGDGKDTRNFTFVKDLEPILSKLLQNKDAIMPTIVSSDEVITIADLANIMRELFGFKRKVIFEGTPNQYHKDKTVNTDLLKTLVPNCRFTPLSTGLEETVAWFSSSYLS